ncbi:MAG: hypothetical protein U5K69_22440 [Balneolaceae bacterium]|nr:hypothetical protein [Balneolaceae bacterium]
MLGTKEYTGIVIEGNRLKIARVKNEKGKVRLVQLDRISLINELQSVPVASQQNGQERESEPVDANDIFGLDELEGSGQSQEDINIDDLDEGGEDMLSLDMVDEADEGEESNGVLLYNALMEIDENSVEVGLNIEAGETIFQIIRDTNFNEVKKKDLIKDIEEKLESIYGVQKSNDMYAYEIRENGSLILSSIEHEPTLLDLVDEAESLYEGKLFINDILPDEISVVGILKANYELEPEKITGIIQFGPQKTRLIFMKGEEIWLVSPIINEGTETKGFLNTVFSKILFQLDTGEVPNLDKIILANNSIGREATSFFEDNFPDIPVENFQFNSEKFDYGDQDPASTDAFTNAIATAWAASGADNEAFPELSLMPERVIERQKIFKLQWHGIVLLLLIFLAPLTINYFYQQNASQIQSMQTELSRLNNQIQQIQPTVDAANELSSKISNLREELVLLDTLSSNTQVWSSKLNIINNGVESNVEGSWFTGMQHNEQGMQLSGYTLFRNQVPQIVNIFSEATLQNVTTEQLREAEVYRYSIVIREFTRDKSQYSPPKPKDLEAILEQ